MNLKKAFLRKFCGQSTLNHQKLDSRESGPGNGLIGIDQLAKNTFKGTEKSKPKMAPKAS